MTLASGHVFSCLKSFFYTCRIPLSSFCIPESSLYLWLSWICALERLYYRLFWKILRTVLWGPLPPPSGKDCWRFLVSRGINSPSVASIWWNFGDAELILRLTALFNWLSHLLTVEAHHFISTCFREIYSAAKRFGCSSISCCCVGRSLSGL